MTPLEPHDLIDPASTASVYVHFPYCTVRCRYGDFNVAIRSRVPAEPYTRAVLAEGEARASAFSGRQLVSAYFGGGTPSLWGAVGVGEVIAGIRRWFPSRREDLEITLEMNPAEASEACLAAYREVGVTRLSLGLQSLSDASLERLYRNHSGADGLAALERALRAGFSSVSADLLFGLPDQSLDDWTDDLTRVAATGVPHLSIYHLTVEARTGLERAVSDGRLRLPTEDVAASQWEAIEPMLRPFGLSGYEISSYAAVGHKSRHNSGYWLGHAYLGLGAGAHSFQPPTAWHASAVAERRENTRPHAEYLATALAGRDPLGWTEAVPVDVHLRERLFTGLRYRPGIDVVALLTELGGRPEPELMGRLKRLTTDGFLEAVGSRLRLTPRGLSVADSVAERIFEGAADRL